MGVFYPVYLRRSDGKFQLTSSKGKLHGERNEPTPDQLDPRPDKNGVSDYFREVPLEDPKHFDWRRKLGGMLARQLGQPVGGKLVYPTGLSASPIKLTLVALLEHAYMLMTLPENYRLYEHVRTTEKEGKTEVKTKTHAAGGNEKQDAYLYGHPAGRKKRYRSPGDFFPHLLWLATDESGDPDNCGCKICSPEELESGTVGAKKQGAVSTLQSAPLPSIKPPTKTFAPRQPPPVPLNALRPTPLPTPKSYEQSTDLRYPTFLYRPGELVWFQRGHAWGLAAVLQRWQGQSRNYNYIVQPLSHPFRHVPAVTKSSDTEMRPWLAWSVPKFTNDGLNQQPRLTYDNADWSGIAEKRYGKGDIEVDASILAAKRVDSTYTLFDVNKSFSPEHGVTVTHYNGMFLGAEKLWLGDPLRLSETSGKDIVVVQQIVECRRAGSTEVYIIADVHRLEVVAHSDPGVPTPASPNTNTHLPVRVNEDLAFRNALSIPRQRKANWFKLIHPRARIELDSIKGRWYETSLVMPILHPDVFRKYSTEGRLGEMAEWMNARGDCWKQAAAARAMNQYPRENLRRETRPEAFGQSIPPHAYIVDGPSQPPASNVTLDSVLATEDNSSTADHMLIDSRLDTAENNDRHAQSPERSQRESDRGFEELMNLDGPDLSEFNTNA